MPKPPPSPSSPSPRGRALSPLPVALWLVIGALAGPSVASAGPLRACWYYLTRPLLGRWAGPGLEVPLHHRLAWRAGFSRLDADVRALRELAPVPESPLLPRTAEHQKVVDLARPRFPSLYRLYAAIVQWQLDEGVIEVPTAESGEAGWAPFDNDVGRALYFAPGSGPRRLVVIGVTYDIQEAVEIERFVRLFSSRPGLAGRVARAAVFLPLPERVNPTTAPASIFVAEIDI